MEIDLASSTYKESHVINGRCVWNEDLNVKTTTSQILNNDVKKLVRILDKNLQNN